MRVACRAIPFRRQTIFFNEISMALDERFTTGRTKCVLQLNNLSRKIPGINIAQSGFAAERSRPQQVFGASVVRRSHLVVLVKRGDVPRDIWRDTAYELRHLPQLVVTVVEARNEQRDNFQPDSHFVQSTNGVKDGL